MRTPTNWLLAWVLTAASSQIQAITVFACEPEWGALAKTLVPDARVRSATSHLQDPHHVEARPSLMAQLRSADFAVCTGAELEAGWLPMLQDRSGNPKVRHGQPSMFYAADHVELIDPYKGAITPFAGDVHGSGNPHIHADPRRILKVAKALASRMSQVFPERRTQIEGNLRGFESDLNARLEQWEKQAGALKGRPVITQHATFGYLWQWLGMRPLVDLEPRPGMPPTAAHLDRILALSKATAFHAIVIAQHHDPKPGRWLANSLGRPDKLLIFPATVTDEQAASLIQWFDLLIARLTQVSD